MEAFSHDARQLSQEPNSKKLSQSIMHIIQCKWKCYELKAQGLTTNWNSIQQ